MSIHNIASTNLFSKLIQPVCIGIFLALITGCGNDDVSDLRKYIVEVNERPKGTIEPLPEIKVVETFIFKPDGLRDPFRPIERNDDGLGIEVAVAGGIRPNAARRKEELESYALDTLKMVGTMSMKSNLWGLVKVSDGSGTIHRVHVGNFMGKNNGKIIRIEEDGIELMEIVLDEKKSGTWKEQQASLVLAE